MILKVLYKSPQNSYNYIMYTVTELLRYAGYKAVMTDLGWPCPLAIDSSKQVLEQHFTAYKRKPRHVVAVVVVVIVALAAVITGAD